MSNYINQKFIKKYLINLYHFTAYYSSGDFYNLQDDIIIRDDKLQLLEKSNLLTFLQDNGINYIAHHFCADSANSHDIIHSYMIYKFNVTSWTLFIIPWICIQTNFNFALIEQSIDAIYTDKKIANYKKINLARTFLRDYLLSHSNQEYHQNISLKIQPLILDKIYNRFSKSNLKLYRKFFHQKAIQYLSNDIMSYIYNFQYLFTLEQIYDISELQQLKNNHVLYLQYFKSDFADTFYHFLNRLYKIPGTFSYANLQYLDTFTLNLKLKRNYINDQIKLLELINKIFQEHQYTSPHISKILARKFLYQLKEL